ncbi:uncharacterized protein LOC133449404 [Cololabis saira]|uniref:uncharacterized protein LOC133449404 n=1 Tax=Cololabis saira TaxID=129043 RepID=UPI002AD4B308|nr:uncharacterized protein LOC133449404 [Cololabis saira]
MDGVLDGAVLLCVCKLACSLLFLPSLAASYSPVSFCCCCLLIFTDFLVTVFLSLVSIFESWLAELRPSGDVIALRFLLFLSQTYGAVLLLTTFLIAVETLIRLLWPHVDVGHRAAGQTASPDEQHCYEADVNARDQEEDGRITEKDGSSAYVVGFLCCLSVWVIVALNVSWQWKLEERWAAACLHTTDSLVRCLPSLLSPGPGTMNPCWGMAFLFFLLLILTISTSLQRQHQRPAQTERTQGDCSLEDLVPALSAPFKPVHPGMEVSEPEKAKSSHAGNIALSWNGVQMLASYRRDLVLFSTDCFPDKRRGKQHEGTKRGILLTFVTEEHVHSPHSCQCGWQQCGFPSLQVNVMIVGVLSIFVLPFNLSVNVLLIRTIDAVLEWCLRSLLSCAANSRDASASLTVTEV